VSYLYFCASYFIWFLFACRWWVSVTQVCANKCVSACVCARVREMIIQLMGKLKCRDNLNKLQINHSLKVTFMEHSCHYDHLRHQFHQHIIFLWCFHARNCFAQLFFQLRFVFVRKKEEIDKKLLKKCWLYWEQV